MKKLVSALILSVMFAAQSFSAPKVALVLSGGGAKGMAEIPLLEKIEELGIRPDMVLGTSMGALIGGLYAAGYSPKEIRRTMQELDFAEIMSGKTSFIESLPAEPFSTHSVPKTKLSFSSKGIGSSPGIVGDQEILSLLSDRLSKILTVTDFDQLPIKYRAMVTDVSSGQPIVLSGGSLLTAIRASISLPLVFTPCPLDDGTGRQAMDGGLRNNIPIALAREMGADIVIAMDVATIVDTPPESISDITSAAVQVFNLIISNNAVEQYPQADIVLRPDLKEFSTIGFNRADKIIEVGEKCVSENKEALDEICSRLRKSGYEFSDLDPERKSTYTSLSDPVIEGIAIRDISSEIPCTLPPAKHFSSVVGKKLDKKTKRWLSNSLEDMRKLYHLSAFYFHPVAGSSDNSVIVELRAKHYLQKPNLIFFGGESALSLAMEETSGHFGIIPDLFTGFYMRNPVDAMIRLSLANTTTAEFSVYPRIAARNNLNFSLDFGDTLKFGRLEPRTYIFHTERLIDKDYGNEVHGGFMLTLSDTMTCKLGVTYDHSYINSTDSTHDLLFNYLSFIASNTTQPFTEFRTSTMEASFAAEYLSGKILPNARFRFRQKIELARNRSAIGYELQASTMRFPYQLNSGYSDYGGIDGMCGEPYGSFRRDFAILGLSYQHTLFSIAGRPVMMILQGKAGIHDNYNTFTASSAPSEKWFDGYNLERTDIGAAVYFAVKGNDSSLIVGAGANSNGKWSINITLK